MTANGYGVSIWDDDNILKLDSVNSCTTLNTVKATELCTLKG